MILFAILRIRAVTFFQYRAAAIAGMATQIFWGVIKVMIFTALYAGASGVEPITLSQAITFAWLGQTLLLLLPWNVDREIEAQIRSGNVAYELLRPIDLYGIYFTRSFAMRSVPTIMRGIPLFFVAWLFFGLEMPFSLYAAAAFLLSLLGALLLAAAITTFVITTLFWTYSGEGILRLLPHTTVLLSGMIVPLPLFPDWMQPFLNWQPFRGILDIPSRLYTGVIPSAEVLGYFTFQLLWAAFFILLGKWLLARATKKFVVVGG